MGKINEFIFDIDLELGYFDFKFILELCVIPKYQINTKYIKLKVKLKSLLNRLMVKQYKKG
tara:strand:+ start:118 stop:300 length:183 start_codon:yes stop_codon:yes gene_type:complete